jgi:alpha-galactosidase
MSVTYLLDEDTGAMGLALVPVSMRELVVPHRVDLRGVPEIETMSTQLKRPYPPAWELDSLVHLAITGDDYAGGFAQGQTLRGSSTERSLTFQSQEVRRGGGGLEVVTRLAASSPRGLVARHLLRWEPGWGACLVGTEVENGSDSPVELCLMTSFSLGRMTPFYETDDPGALAITRWRGGWSAEGRRERRLLEELGLERSWAGHSVNCERFGQNGTKPAERWFPFVVAEDTRRGVAWGACLKWAGSWQIELYRKDDFLSMSGGLADREMGHWHKRIAPGEVFSSPKACVSTCQGGADSLCDRLVGMQSFASRPAMEEDLPIVFNEWCTSWGNPTRESLIALADLVSTWGVKYLVLDAGWYKEEGTDWDKGHGDWRASTKLFPGGLAPVCAEIRRRGLVPGIWFEPETVGARSRAWAEEDVLLHRDGVPIRSGDRRFLDFRKSEVHERLERRMLDLIEECGFGYLKIDCNETPGWGADGAESQGEGLRLHVQGFYRFLARIRERFPELVIENCCSGGMRNEPSMVELCAQSSFSDAHETRDIPVIAANLHNLVAPDRCQIWAVLRADDKPERIAYSLAAAFLGRMCLSGDATLLSAEQIAIVKAATALYRRAAPVIREGSSRRFGPEQVAYRKLRGWQTVVRSGQGAARGLTLVVLHVFESVERELVQELPEGCGMIIGSLRPSSMQVKMEGGRLVASGLSRHTGAAILLGRDSD